MDIRPMNQADVDGLVDIDATAEALAYLHVEQSGEGLAVGWKVTERPLREKRIQPNRLTDDTLFTARQIAAGHDEGMAVVTELRGAVVAMALAKFEPERGVVRLLEVRVDFEVRREGMGTALVYQVLQTARRSELRAVVAETRSDNVPGAEFLLKLGFKLAGVDTQRESNHDLVKEQATLVWYAAVD